MVGFPAARVADFHICPAFNGPVPHIGGPVLPPCAPTVLTGGMMQARMGDLCQCVGPPDVIAAGSSSVIVMGKPAARILVDACAHGGRVMLGCFTVFIGDSGGSGGASLSPAGIGNALGAGAFPGQQHFNNCGVQSSAQIIFLATGERTDEVGLLKESVTSGRADPGNSSNPASSGGTSPAARQAILAAHDVESDVVPTTRQALSDAVHDGKGVIVNVDAGTLWNDPTQPGGHAVTVTGGTYDERGNLQTVWVNDTGTGQRSEMPADHLMDAADARPGGSNMNVTRDSVLPRIQP